MNNRNIYVAVVDDDESICRSLNRLLRAARFQPITYPSAEAFQALAALGIKMQIVEARASVRDRLRAEGLAEKLGGIDRFQAVAQIVGEFEREKRPDQPSGPISLQ
ncbi:MAG: hypothetical protein ND895_15240 [Pyrinomonadaceae bacterium]|nr:hypothetical protein [Pyrinomonadaceae bacterium]